MLGHLLQMSYGQKVKEIKNNIKEFINNIGGFENFEKWGYFKRIERLNR